MAKTFKQLLQFLGLSDKALNQPLTEEVYSDPNRPEIQLLLQLYSMEPPFYADVNNAQMNMDEDKVE